MPLLVVPAAPEDSDNITLAEWDALLARDKVFFENEDHPLATRLQAHGRDVGGIDEKAIAPHEDRYALVVAPGSPRAIDLARQGATVTSGSSEAPDALTAAHGSYLVRRAESSLGSLALVMARLRSDDGCPWDREQSHESLQPHLVEETYEVIDAIERGADGEDLAEELGDVLLQVAFHSQLAAGDDRFDLADVADHIVAKLLRRHPHVFGETVVADAAEVVRNWESIKRTEKGRTDAFDDVPNALPGLLLASKTQKRAAGLGFAASESDARTRVAELASEEGDLGDILFWAVAVARAEGIDPDSALRRAVARFRAGFGPDPG